MDSPSKSIHINCGQKGRPQRGALSFTHSLLSPSIVINGGGFFDFNCQVAPTCEDRFLFPQLIKKFIILMEGIGNGLENISTVLCAIGVLELTRVSDPNAPEGGFVYPSAPRSVQF